MTAVIIDSNVLIDVITDDSIWGDWSSHSLQRAADEAMLVINALSYAEVSIGFDSIELQDRQGAGFTTAQPR